MIHQEDLNTKEFRESLKKGLVDAIMSIFQVDEEGQLWVVDKNGKRIDKINIIDDEPKEKKIDDRKAIKEACKMSLQKKEQRLVINLPEWMKDKIQDKANRTGSSMNEIIRMAIAEYLAK